MIRIAVREALSPNEDAAEVVTDGGEDDVCGVALAAP